MRGQAPSIAVISGRRMRLPSTAAATGMFWRSSARRKGSSSALVRASTACRRHSAPGRWHCRTARASTAASSSPSHTVTVGSSPGGRTAGWGERARTRPAAASTSGVDRKLVRMCSTAQPGRCLATLLISSGSEPFHP